MAVYAVLERSVIGVDVLRGRQILDFRYELASENVIGIQGENPIALDLVEAEVPLIGVILEFALDDASIGE